jgi:hypothetical protein
VACDKVAASAAANLQQAVCRQVIHVLKAKTQANLLALPSLLCIVTAHYKVDHLQSPNAAFGNT